MTNRPLSNPYWMRDQLDPFMIDLHLGYTALFLLASPQFSTILLGTSLLGH